MGALAIAVPYVLFVWWFSTGAVLLLVGLSERHGLLLKCGAACLFASSLLGARNQQPTIRRWPVPIASSPVRSCCGARSRSHCWRAG